MREILFQGKQKRRIVVWVSGKMERKPSEWFVGDLSHIAQEDGAYYIFPADGYNSAEYYEVDPETIGQFTGERDRDGNRIFEKDILFWPHGEKKLTVLWAARGACWVVEDENGYRRPLQDVQPFSCQKIGNVYDGEEAAGNG